jgi:hypothetical protein
MIWKLNTWHGLKRMPLATGTLSTLWSVGRTDAHGDSEATLSVWAFDDEVGEELSPLITYLNPAI